MTTVGDVMGVVAIAVRREASFAELVETMRRFQVGTVTVIDAERRPVGMVSREDVLRRDVVRRGGPAGPETGPTAGELMTGPAVALVPGSATAEAARLMRVHGVAQLPVVDPVTGRIVGTIHLHDLPHGPPARGRGPRRLAAPPGGR
ncbi:CBS domain-containing protein [Planomonospora sp. ID82291]|uniref:CBS domain-containing protein n=1 Tax=Planomonospora sp. ID82291 TaxID=2738136 RepID=UPI0018C42CC3|nr:CBS domain-containing protein [Planomonospora sp. ID82291]MBG0816520.1 CBS domain-containing protein [Planomonospora sp. ID82291]